MTISELGAIGEFLGSVLTVVTLVYLAIQVRQNTRHTRAQMGHDGWIAVSANEAGERNSDTAAALARVDRGEERPSDADLRIVDVHYRTLALHMGRVEHMTSQGLEVYSVEETARAFIDQFNTPSGRAWLEVSHTFAESLAPQITARLLEMLEDPDAPSRSAVLGELRRILDSDSDAGPT